MHSWFYCPLLFVFFVMADQDTALFGLADFERDGAYTFLLSI